MTQTLEENAAYQRKRRRLIREGKWIVEKGKRGRKPGVRATEAARKAIANGTVSYYERLEQKVADNIKKFPNVAATSVERITKGFNADHAGAEEVLKVLQRVNTQEAR